MIVYCRQMTVTIVTANLRMKFSASHTCKSMVSFVPYLILPLIVLYFFRWLEEETTVDELENMSKDEKEVTETDPIRDLEI